MAAEQSPIQKEEDFPIATLRFLEATIHIIKSRIMLKAAEIAKQESPPEEEVYVVEAKHVDTALEEMGLKQILS